MDEQRSRAGKGWSELAEMDAQMVGINYRLFVLTARRHATRMQWWILNRDFERYARGEAMVGS